MMDVPYAESHRRCLLLRGVHFRWSAQGVLLEASEAKANANPFWAERRHWQNLKHKSEHPSPYAAGLVWTFHSTQTTLAVGSADWADSGALRAP